MIVSACRQPLVMDSAPLFFSATFARLVAESITDRGFGFPAESDPWNSWNLWNPWTRTYKRVARNFPRYHPSRYLNGAAPVE